jgi:hypothetical protein
MNFNQGKYNVQIQFTGNLIVDFYYNLKLSLKNRHRTSGNECIKEKGWYRASLVKHKNIQVINF